MPRAIGKLARAVDPAAADGRRDRGDVHAARGWRGSWAFLGLAAPAADFSRRIHEGAAGEMTPAARAKARAWLAPQYEFVADWLGRRPAAGPMGREP